MLEKKEKRKSNKLHIKNLGKIIHYIYKCNANSIILAENIYIMSTKSILKKSLLHFRAIFKQRLPTGFEAEGQKLWMEYLKPYVDTFITDNYGTVWDY
jgi:hypothetical protein